MTVSGMLKSLLVLIMALMVPGCAPEKPQTPPVAADRSGRPLRVVSLIPSVTMTMFELGAGDMLVGVTRYCDRPEAARSIPRVGGILDVSVEALAEVRPDVVIGSPSVLKGRVTDILGPAGVRFLPLTFENFDDVRDGITAIGDAVGRKAEAAELVSKFDAGLASLGAGMPPLRAMFVVGTRPLVVAGPNSFQGQLMTAMGLENVVEAGRIGFPTWSLEQVIKARPDVIIDGIVGGEPSATLLTDAGVQAPVVRIPDGAILLPGPAAVVAAARLAEAIRATPGLNAGAM